MEGCNDYRVRAQIPSPPPQQQWRRRETIISITITTHHHHRNNNDGAGTLDRGAGYYWEERMRNKRPCLVETGGHAGRSRVLVRGVGWNVMFSHVIKRGGRGGGGRGVGCGAVLQHRPPLHHPDDP